MPHGAMDDSETTDAPAFENLLGELETIVAQLESGELSLEEGLAAFERGMKLSRQTEAILDAVDARVEVLMRGEQTPRPAAMDGSDA